MTYNVQKNTPLPKSPVRRPRKYPLAEMGVGEMFFVPHMTRNTLVQYVSAVGKELKRKFSTRLLWMVKRKGVWVPATEDTPRAVQGVGVWRCS